MDKNIFPYKLNKKYYNDIKTFTDKFLKYTKKFNYKNEEETLEALCIGVYWYLYGNTALDLNSNIHQALSNLSEYRRAFPEDKIFIDELRGKLLTKYLFKPFEKNHKPLTKENLNLLIKFLEATGDYVDQIPHFKNFNHNLEDTITITKWFCKNSKKHLQEYTKNLEKYIKKYSSSHLMEEDIIFYHGHELEYHLNMLGAEILNRAFKKDYDSHSRKAILLPSCMNIHNKKCKSKKETLGKKCTFCNPKCNVYKISKKYKKYEIYMISHESTAFKNATKEDLKDLSIVGITCVLNLISGGWKATNLQIPPQCVLLEHVACKNHWLNEDIPAKINEEELEKRI